MPIFSGIVDSSKASLLVITISWSMGKFGSCLCFAPVAIMMLLAEMICSVSSILMEFESKNRAVPSIWSTLFFLRRNLTP